MIRKKSANIDISISENGTIQKLGTVSYSHSIATVAVSLADLTQYMNVTDRQTDTQPDTA